MATPPAPRYQRITLNKAQAASAAGTELFEILEQVLDDGVLDDAEIKRLKMWLERTATAVDFPGIQLLHDTVVQALADGVVTEEERHDIVSVVLRVLPKAERQAVIAHLALLEADESGEVQFAEGRPADASSVPAGVEPEPLDESRPPRCKRWKLFVPGREEAVGVVNWQTVRFLYATSSFGGDEATAPVDESAPRRPVNQWRFFVNSTATVDREVEAIMDPSRATLGARTPASPRQLEVLGELHWPFGTAQIQHYRHADWLIKAWSQGRGLGEDYEYSDPNSPWSWNRDPDPVSHSPRPTGQVTEAQLRYLRVLGKQVPPETSKREASRIIEAAVKSGASVSNRQMMVLRFWNKLELRERGKPGVIEWMDNWYMEDPDRRAAWELWKEENRDRGRQDSSDKVPVGAGYHYLKRVKGGDVKQLGGCGVWILGGLIVGAFLWFLSG